jgi:secreted trypsin-like serine protease
MRPLPLAAALLAALVLPASAGAIVGGQPATRSYPHMGALLYDGSFTCGSSLVAPDYVLTAAHCVTEQDDSVTPAGKLKVQLGSPDRTRPAETLAVTQVTREPDYDTGTATYDLALLKLERPARETPIRIADAGEKAMWAPGSRATVAGWGVQFWPDPGLTVSDQLREVDVPVQSDADCEAYATTVDYDAKTELCAGETTGGKDACQGDSGGPLMHIGSGNVLTLIGVVSQGMGCGLPTQYGVYARVGEGPLRAWLDSALPRPAPAALQAPASAPAAPKAKAKPKAKHKKRKHKKRKHKKRKHKKRKHKRKKRQHRRR